MKDIQETIENLRTLASGSEREFDEIATQIEAKATKLRAASAATASLSTIRNSNDRQAAFNAQGARLGLTPGEVSACIAMGKPLERFAEFKRTQR